MGVPEFVQALTSHAPPLAAPLRGPAPPADVETLQRQLNVPLPPAVRDMYATADGQDGIVPGVLFGLTWLPARRAAQEHATWMDLAQADASLSSDPTGAIEAVTFHRGWLPLATDGGGNGLAVDLAPGETGTSGQVITYGPDETTRLVVAPSVSALFHWAAQAVKGGEMQVRGDDVTYRGEGSFLDALRDMPRPLE
ncbi:SMI1/KNR4 family protein (plasmid) [Deinococcus taeanensis]|uniref:SMI1/KNR4 family protein n=1 Tax=Deinococcus taeanensis TaxID=2737050 RepID=UPI001CDC3B43|nr:SMI1/KNR4 family protein [Deinococcus taeanensis]UBV45171.1 SMI1/KNR4 family protein [Deinococcus taeanensis]